MYVLLFRVRSEPACTARVTPHWRRDASDDNNQPERSGVSYRQLWLALLWLLLAAPARAELVFAFDEQFTPQEQALLSDWIEEVAAGIEDMVGPFPFDVHVHFERARAREPVPWANTLRGRHQGVRFHVDPRFPKQALLNDWTAAHELSHLILPSLGRRNAWFAEGFASFMQFQVMHHMGILDDAALAESYRRKIAVARRGYPYGDAQFVATTQRLRAERRFKTMYWGGAIFFMRLARELEHSGKPDLLEMLSAYLACCRNNRDSLAGLTEDLDRIADRPVLQKQLSAFSETRGFPKVSEQDLIPLSTGD